MISGRSCTLQICGLVALHGAESLAQQVPAGFTIDLVYGVPDIEQ